MAKLLLADDDLQLSELVVTLLSQEGYAVDTVHTGTEAWQRLQSNHYDLAILDWDMPDLDGIDVLKRYRLSGAVTPVLLLTGHSSIDDKERGFESGANDYLTKPFHPRELCLRIKNILRSTTGAAMYKALGQGNEAVLAQADLQGTQLAAKYEFSEFVGEGSMGLVFKAKHPTLERWLAIKMLNLKESSQEIYNRFEREAKALSRLNHSNIVIVHDFGITERRQPYIVMEFVEGTDLDAILDRQRFLPLQDSLAIMLQVCEGMTHAHAMGILHRDIKPANIMLSTVPRCVPTVKIVDFGLARLMEASSKSQIGLTSAGQLMGSPPYMSPEQIRGLAVDERADVYSVGCVIYELISAIPPFLGDTAMEIVLQHLNAQPRPLREVRPDLDLPEEIDRIVLSTLAKGPGDRPAMEELSNALGQMLTKLK